MSGPNNEASRENRIACRAQTDLINWLVSRGHDRRELELSYMEYQAQKLRSSA